jgi:hypothetical protein
MKLPEIRIKLHRLAYNPGVEVFNKNDSYLAMCPEQNLVMLLHVDWKACQIVLAKTARIRIWDPKRHNMTFNQKKQQRFCMKTSFDSAK